MGLCLACLNQSLGDALITQQSHTPEPRDHFLEEFNPILAAIVLVLGAVALVEVVASIRKDGR